MPENKARPAAAAARLHTLGVEATHRSPGQQQRAEWEQPWRADSESL